MESMAQLKSKKASRAKRLKLFDGISQLWSFEEFAEADGRHPERCELRSIPQAALLVDTEGRVLWKGAKKNFRREAKAWLGEKLETISLRGSEVLPAFVEAHTHLLYAGDRSDEFERRNRGETYLQIAEAGGGIRRSVELTRRASASQLKALLHQRLQELAQQGVATVEIKSGYAQSVDEELRHLHLIAGCVRASRRQLSIPRVVGTALSAHSVPPGVPAAEWLRKVREIVWPKLPREIRRVDVFIEAGAFSREDADLHLREARRRGLEITVHADQLSLSGGTDMGLKHQAMSVDHLIEITATQRRGLAQSAETVAMLLPVADVYARLPYPNARELIDAGARVALATDHNPGTAPALDIALVGVLARTQMRMTLKETLCAYTYNAARALGLSAETGCLRLGSSADFIALQKGASLAQLFYEVGPRGASRVLAGTYRGGQRLA
jgi:imidazolonepropionase